MKIPAPLVILFLLPALPLAAQEWDTLNPHSDGTGGAGVAVTDEVVSGYGNPGALGLGVDDPLDPTSGGFGLRVSGFAVASLEGDILSTVDQVNDLYTTLGGGAGFDTVQTELNAELADPQNVQDAISLIETLSDLNNEGEGAIARAGGSVDLRMGSFGIFYRDVVHAGIDPFADFSDLSALTTGDITNILNDAAVSGVPGTAGGATLAARIAAETGLNAAEAQTVAFQTENALGGAGDAAFQNALIDAINLTLGGGVGVTDTLYNTGSGIIISGIRLREAGLSFGLPVTVSGTTPVCLGLTVKEVIGETFREIITASEIEDGETTFEDVLDDIDENMKRSNEMNFDAGIMVTLPMVSVGLSARNIIPMEFDVEGTTTDYEVDPQLRIGAQVDLADILRVRGEADLLETDFSALNGYESRMVGGGAELDIYLVRLRGGVYGNLASDFSDPVYTAGIGVNFFGLTLDVAGQYSPSEVEVEIDPDGDAVELPERIGLSAMLAFQSGF